MVKEVKKRNGNLVQFCELNIRRAILNANNDVSIEEQATDEEIDKIISKIKCIGIETVHIEVIQDIIEKELMKLGRYKLAKEYIIYRYVRKLGRELTDTETSIVGLIRGTNTEVINENSNKNAYTNSTQRDLMAGEISKDISKKIILDDWIVKANEDCIFHWHDMDYTAQNMINCCLINIKDILDNGTVMNGTMIESPHSFRTACNIMTQVIANIASNQYGGQSVAIEHLGKYLRISKERYIIKMQQYFDDSGIVYTDKQLEKCVNDMLMEELKDGVQTIQYQIITLMTTNGQAPFLSLFMYLRDGGEYEEEVYLIIKEIIRQRLEGIKNKDGVFVTPTFPKLLYVLDENNCRPGSKYWELTQMAIECSNKRGYPDYISAKKMRENYDGNVFSCMGCVDGKEVVTIKDCYDREYKDIKFKDFWHQVSLANIVKQQSVLNEENCYIDLTGYKIFDTKKNDFVDCYRIIRNTQSLWYNIEFTDNYKLECTNDHPFETENRGIVLAEDLKIGDLVLTKTGVQKVFVIREKKDKKFSYDVTTESEHFEVSGIYSHNCRSFLSVWHKTPEYVKLLGEPKEEIGKPKFEGRFNMGVVSLNLPQIALETKRQGGDKTMFFSMLHERLSMCYKALLKRYQLLRGVLSDSSPVHWQFGGISRLAQGTEITPLLENGYATISLGYIGIYETVYAMLGVSHTTEEGKEFALQIMKSLRNAVDTWKEETGSGFGLYGTPAESLCYTFAKHDLEEYGSVPNVTDKGYYTNSYHIDVRERVNAFEKFAFEAQFQDISSGGAISYVEIPNLQKNIPALEKLVQFIYDNIQYAEFNSKSDYCYSCGYDGEIKLNENNQWQCPNCGETDMKKMIVTRRTCGYLGQNDWNIGKRKEIGQRVLHL